jgi:hypothetical protein
MRAPPKPALRGRRPAFGRASLLCQQGCLFFFVFFVPS